MSKAKILPEYDFQNQPLRGEMIAHVDHLILDCLSYYNHYTFGKIIEFDVKAAVKCKDEALYRVFKLSVLAEHLVRFEYGYPVNIYQHVDDFKDLQAKQILHNIYISLEILNRLSSNHYYKIEQYTNIVHIIQEDLHNKEILTSLEGDNDIEPIIIMWKTIGKSEDEMYANKMSALVKLRALIDKYKHENEKNNKAILKPKQKLTKDYGEELTKQFFEFINSTEILFSAHTQTGTVRRKATSEELQIIFDFALTLYRHAKLNKYI